MNYHDPIREANEIRDQLASEKRRLTFFLGAGTSMAVGLPGIEDLTESVVNNLVESHKVQFKELEKDLGGNPNVEIILDRLRLYRELIGDSEEKEYIGIKGCSAAKELDSLICREIFNIVSKQPDGNIKPHLILAQWLRSLHAKRDFPVEIFTTNYDLLLERSMEELGVPFFDGFVGSVSPFFVPESVEADRARKEESACPPTMWTRIWKLHGSINWQITGDTKRITRFSGKVDEIGTELVIFPTREKYSESRKLPFITFQDRFRKSLASGENLLLIIGYSFSDQHINEIILQGLRSNPRLSIIAFSYLALEDALVQYGRDYRNLTIYGPDKSCISGIEGNWKEINDDRSEQKNLPYWDFGKNSFTLGDFNSFGSFLEGFVGFRIFNKEDNYEKPLSVNSDKNSEGASNGEQ